MNCVWGEQRGGGRKGQEFLYLKEYLFSVFSCLTVFQVYKCSQFSQTPSRKVVLAATVRLKTDIFWRPWTNIGMKTAWNVPVVTVAWGRWALPCTPKPTLSFVAETIWGRSQPPSVCWQTWGICSALPAELLSHRQGCRARCLWRWGNKYWNMEIKLKSESKSTHSQVVEVATRFLMLILG